MKKLIVDTSIEFVDRTEITRQCAVICRDENNRAHLCIPTHAITLGEHTTAIAVWQVISIDSGEVVAEAPNFTDLFNTNNSTGAPLRGWKFWKVA